MTDIVVSQTPDVIITADPTATTLVVTTDAVQTIEVPQQGPPGIQGPKGDTGAPGPAPTAAQIQTGVQPLIGAVSGIAGLDANGHVPLANLTIRTAQVTRAARPILIADGGSFSGFLSGLGGPDATDGSWEAVYVEAFAPPNGLLAGLLSAYLVTVLGQSAGQAAATLSTIWSAANGISP